MNKYSYSATGRTVTLFFDGKVVKKTRDKSPLVVWWFKRSMEAV